MDRSRTVMVAVLMLAAVLAAGVVVAVYRGNAAGGGTRPWVIASIVIGVMVLVALLLIITAARRGRSGGDNGAPQVAERLGLTYEKKGERGFHRAFGPLPGIPSGGSVQHVFTGSLDGRLLSAFQHMYMIHTGQASVPIYHVACATEAPHWPAVTIAPRKGWTRLLDRLLRRRRLLLEDEAFNAAFTVKTEDEDFALTLLHPEMQRFLASHRRVAWRVNPGWLALVYSGTMKFDRLEASLDRLREFWSLVPEELEAW